MEESEIKLRGKRVLISPLDWGLGHATRCVPIIHTLLSQGKDVIIAGYGNSGDFLRGRFPELEYIDLPGVEVRYSKGSSQVFAMMRQVRSILKSIKRENEMLQRLVEDRGVDVVISDNRFGLYTHKCHTIYMTHQLMIKTPRSLRFIEKMLWYIHRRYIKKYTECWVPDYAGVTNLSGDLSHKYPLIKGTKFIGPLSRFQVEECDYKLDLPIYDHMVIVSGPEPQRSIFEKEKVKELREAGYGNILVVRGLIKEGSEVRAEEGVDYVGHLPDKEFLYHLKLAKKIYCRSGYSTIMDLHVVGRSADMVPTPGQTEQEYLCEYYLIAKHCDA